MFMMVLSSCDSPVSRNDILGRVSRGKNDALFSSLCTLCTRLTSPLDAREGQLVVDKPTSDRTKSICGDWTLLEPLAARILPSIGVRLPVLLVGQREEMKLASVYTAITMLLSCSGGAVVTAFEPSTNFAFPHGAVSLFWRRTKLSSTSSSSSSAKTETRTDLPEQSKKGVYQIRREEQYK